MSPKMFDQERCITYLAWPTKDAKRTILTNGVHLQDIGCKFAVKLILKLTQPLACGHTGI
jgi:hypothetical protein